MDKFWSGRLYENQVSHKVALKKTTLIRTFEKVRSSYLSVESLGPREDAKWIIFGEHVVAVPGTFWSMARTHDSFKIMKSPI